MESKMKGTCVDGTIPKLFEGRMLVRCVYILTLFKTYLRFKGLYYDVIATEIYISVYGSF